MSSSLPSEELSAWIRLTLEPDLGPAQARLLLAGIGLPQDIYALPSASLAKILPHDLARQLSRPASPQIEETIARTLKWLTEPGHHLVTLADPGYPQALLDIHDPPLALYVNGRVELLNRPTLAIVGARNATAGGLDNAAAFSRYLAGRGWCIASGLALGIDAAAHQGALAAGPQAGGTIAVLGTGIDRIYPAANLELAHRIAAEGVLVSEFPLGTPSIAYQFPKRNRIVAGLAKGVLVVEAAKRSGSLITARLAAETGREVFAIPGSIHSPQSRGCHALIRQGAKLVESGQDIDEELGQLQPGSATAAFRAEKTNRRKAGASSSHDDGGTMAGGELSQESAAHNSPETADIFSTVADMGGTAPASGAEDHTEDLAPAGRAQKRHAGLLAALGYDPVHIDILQARTGMDWPVLNSQLLELELSSVIARLPDGRFQRC